MNKSDSRILTTHVGSLPRSKPLLALLVDKEQGQPVDENEMRRLVALDLERIVARQKAAGIDIASDGEIPRIGFSFYVKDRMSGFGGVSKRSTGTEFQKFPDYVELKASGAGGQMAKSVSMYSPPECQDVIRYDPALSAARYELGAFADALTRGGGRSAFAETFVTAASPGIVSTTMLRSTQHTTYRSDKDYVFALARELKNEYELIVKEGHVLQIDAPDLAGERQIMFADRPLEEFLARAEIHVEALNIALADIPKDRVRMHVCWGNLDRPHVDDVELEPLLPLLYETKVGAISLACANPRHQHEYKLFKKYPPPRDMSIIPGVIDVTTNIVEHPEVVADRIERYVEAIGDRTRIIAGTDCGLSTFAGYVLVAEDVAWTKLQVLAQGAAIATKRLW